MTSFAELKELREKLQEAETSYALNKRNNQRETVEELKEIISQMRVLEDRAKRMADEVGLVFYYSSGYEEWSWMDAENWSSSSANC